jgi:hypothetical protein
MDNKDGIVFKAFVGGSEKLRGEIIRNEKMYNLFIRRKRCRGKNNTLKGNGA